MWCARTTVLGITVGWLLACGAGAATSAPVVTPTPGEPAAAPPVIGFVTDSHQLDGAGCACNEGNGSIYVSGEAAWMNLDGVDRKLGDAKTGTGKTEKIRTEKYSVDGYTVTMSWKELESFEGGSTSRVKMRVERDGLVTERTLTCGCGC